MPFNVPHVHVLHTVRMYPLHDRATPYLQQEVLGIESTLPLKLFIRHTRRWCDGEAWPSRDSNALDFKYEIHAPPEDWTIGGQKQGHFSARVSYPHD